MTDHPRSEPTPISDGAAEHLVDAYADAAETAGGNVNATAIADADLLRAYQRTDGEPGNPEADVLLAEIERRGLDV